MATMSTRPGAAAPVPGWAVRASVVLSLLVALGVLLQSVWAGGFLAVVYGGGSGGEVHLLLHEVGANATFGLLALEAVPVLLTPLRRVRPVVVSGVVLGGLLVAVIGLGYVGGASVALHVPLAVTAFGAAAWHVVAVAGSARTARRSATPGDGAATTGGRTA